jgi:hypothetical protein
MRAPNHFGTYRPVRLLRPGPPRPDPHRPATSRRMIFKRLFIVTAAIVFGVFLFSVENAAKLLTDVTAAMFMPRTLQPMQSSLSPSDSRDSSIAESQPISGKPHASTLVEPTHADVEAPAPESLFRQFQAWAAEQDAQQLATVQPDQDHSSSLKTVSGQSVEGTTGSIVPVQNDRGSRSVRRTRKPVSPRDSPKEIRQTESARVPAPPRNAAKLSQASVGRN